MALVLNACGRCCRFIWPLFGLPVPVRPVISRQIRQKRAIIEPRKKCHCKIPKMPVEIEQAVAPMPSPKKLRTVGPTTDSVVLRYAKLTDLAYTPTRGSALAAGYDLYSANDDVIPAKEKELQFPHLLLQCFDYGSAYDEVIPAKGKKLVKTDIQIALPNGCYGRVAPRSGLAHKHFIDVGAGVIDQDYRGNVGVVMFNFNDTEFVVKKGDRIAQLICERIYLPELTEEPTLDDTERGSGGFGSTGKN